MADATLPTVVLVNFNGGEAILRCLEALRGQSRTHCTVVIDNASTDGSLRAIADRFPAVNLVPVRRNVGFARAANIGVLRASTSPTVVLLNPDTTPRPDFVEQLVAPLEQDVRIGAVAGTLVFTSRPDIVASAGIDVHRNGVAIDACLGQRLTAHRGVQPVFGASGGAAAFRTATFIAAGGFCEAFFMYLEDVDLAWRLRLRGWDAVSSANAIATHDYSASGGEGSPFKRRLLARNRIWMLARCLPSPMWIRDRQSIVGFDAAAFAYAAARWDGASLAGRTSGMMGLPLRLMERTRIQAAASIEWNEIDRWVQPAISPARLLQLRSLTARYAISRKD
jgi:GT2 family glycosyltransferase